MKPRIYVDTNVYMDLFEGRKNKFKDLAECALCTFRQVREKKYDLVISDFVIEEFTKYCDKKIILNFLKGFKGEQVIKVISESKDRKKARKLCSDNFDDALHVILALKGKCVFLITQNIKHLGEFNNLIEICSPESL